MSRKLAVLAAIIVVVLAVASYFYQSNSSSPDYSLHSSDNIFDNESAELALTESTKKQLLSKSEGNACLQLEKAQEIYSFNSNQFISNKAIQWYFEGYDKSAIAETLAALFGYQTAYRWFSDVQKYSRYDDNHQKLLDSIHNLSFDGNYKRRIHNGPHYTNARGLAEKENADFDAIINQYSDVSAHILTLRISKAIENKDKESALEAIAQLRNHIDNPIFFEHPITDVGLQFRLAELPQEDINEIIRALADLAPIYINNAKKHTRATISSLNGLTKDLSMIALKSASSLTFIADPTILELIENLKEEFPNLNNEPTANEVCSSQENVKGSVSKKIVKIDTNKIDESLSPVWGGVKTFFCGSGPLFFENVVGLNHKIHQEGLILDELTDFESFKSHSIKLKQALDKMTEYEKFLLFNKKYSDKNLSLEQIKSLIDMEVTPTNSDFYFLIRDLSLEDQKHLLTEYQFQLTPVNVHGRTLIANAIEFDYSLKNTELVAYLIDQGFPLKFDEDSPDPLWIQLHAMKNRRAESSVPLDTLQSLLNNTELNEIHIDMMQKIKNLNKPLYEKLITHLPRLELPEPEVLYQIECG